MADLERARVLFEQALALHSAERLPEAEALYRQALELAPERPSLLVNLGAVALRLGRGREAQRLARRALLREPDSPEALALLVEAKRAREGVAAALAEAELLLDRHPQVPALHLQRSSLLAELGRFEEALSSIEQTLAAEPGNVIAASHRAQLLLACRREPEAIQEVVEVLRQAPRFLPAGEIWARVRLRKAEVPIEERELLVRALDTPWASPRELLPMACAHLQEDPKLAPWLHRVDSIWPQRLPAHSLIDLRLPGAVFAQPLLRALLRQPMLPGRSLQRLLINLRAWLLERAAHGGAETVWSDAQLSFACALAAHALRNQYLWPLQPDDREWSALLQQRIQSALDAGTAIAAAWLPSLLSAKPISVLRDPQRLLEQRWPAPVQALLSQAVSSDDAGAELPSLQWLRLPVSPRALQLPDFLAERVWPMLVSPPPETPSPRVLALGCGGGEWALELTARVQGARSLALDPDPACTAALRRQAQRLQLSGLQVEEGDIEQVGQATCELIDTGRMFLRGAPCLEQALPAIAQRLAPRGLLRLRLPSQKLCAALAAARAHFGKARIQATEDPLHAARELILGLPIEDPAAFLIELPEFHVPGPCRELLFEMTDRGRALASLAAPLSAASLRWLGFEFSAAERQLCSESLQPADLSGWAELEADLPALFPLHYTLWLARA
jgi:tetratricopeptide (TPR) repeat protein